jgi:hypothetical protein
LAASESTPVNVGLSCAIAALVAQITAMNVEMIVFIFSSPVWS